mgnify:CR=1 FL=1
MKKFLKTLFVKAQEPIAMIIIFMGVLLMKTAIDELGGDFLEAFSQGGSSWKRRDAMPWKFLFLTGGAMIFFGFLLFIADIKKEKK